MSSAAAVCVFFCNNFSVSMVSSTDLYEQNSVGREKVKDPFGIHEFHSNHTEFHTNQFIFMEPKNFCVLKGT
jgi:hypothetical protein